MNNEIKTTKVVIDKQPKLDVDELINRYNESQKRINKAIECIEKEYDDYEEFIYGKAFKNKLLKILKGE